MYSTHDDIIRPAFSTVKKKLVFDERLDRQLRIQGWDQAALDKAKIAVVGDNDLLASLFIMSASALGINNISAIGLCGKAMTEREKKEERDFMFGLISQDVISVFFSCSEILSAVFFN